MKQLFAGIIAKYDASATLKAALPGGMWVDEAPQSVNTAHATIHLISDTAERTFREKFEECLVQFSIWVKDDSSTTKSSVDIIGDAFDALKAVYDDTILTVTGYTCIHTTRESANLTRDSEWNGWAYHITYRIELQKT